MLVRHVTGRRQDVSWCLRIADDWSLTGPARVGVPPILVPRGRLDYIAFHRFLNFIATSGIMCSTSSTRMKMGLTMSICEWLSCTSIGRCFSVIRHRQYRRHQVEEGFTIEQSGFSLIEVMIVVVILAILATLLVPHVMGRTEDAKRAAAKAQIQSIESALQLYRLDNGLYPSNEQGLQALVSKPAKGPTPTNWKTGGYLQKIPADPWGHAYKYTNPSPQADFEVVSFGADGVQGGEGKNADIVSGDLDKKS